MARKEESRFRAGIRSSERQRLNGRQMEETSLPSLTGGRSGGMEFSKDSSLGDRQAAGPGSKVWCPRAVTEQGSTPPSCVSRPSWTQSQRSCRTLDSQRPGVWNSPPDLAVKHWPSLSLSSLVCKMARHHHLLKRFIEISVSSI